MADVDAVNLRRERAIQISQHVDDLERNFESGGAIFSALELQLQDIEESVEKLMKNSIAMASVMRSSLTRSYKAIKNSVESIRQLSSNAVEIADELRELANANCIEFIRLSVDILGDVFRLYPIFDKLEERMQTISSSFSKIVRAMKRFIAAANGVASELSEALQEDLDAFEAHVRSTVAQMMFATKRAMRMICPFQKTQICDRDGDVSMFGESLKQYVKDLESAVLQDVVGDEALDSFANLRSGMTKFGDELRNIATRVEGKADELQRPPQGFLEIIASPFVKTYEVVDLACEFGSDMAHLPQLWGQTVTLIKEGEQLFPKVQEHWENIWLHFIKTVQKLCAHFGIEFCTDFENKELLDVDFHPKNRTFLSGVEVQVVNCLNDGACLQGARQHTSECFSFCKSRARRALKPKHVVAEEQA